jgi:perosamine synthetase
MESEPISFFHTYVSPKAIARVTGVLESGWLNEGAVTKEFEESLASVLGVANPVAVNSGTAALHLALAICNIGPGDEVIIPPQTFVATGIVVLMQGATPVFADIDPTTGNISTQSIIEKITPRTKAIIPVHWGGYPCDMDEIKEIARQHNLVAIEDAAHALGATYKSRPIGAISRFTAFSFQAIKHLTTGDGGMLCCPDISDAKQATARRWFGIDREKSVRSPLGARGFDIETYGYKYHLNNVAAALGLGNLEDFLPRLAKRRQTATFYRENLKDVAGLQLLNIKSDREHAYWLFTLLVEQRDDFVSKLAEAGVPTSVVDLRIDRNSVFGGARDDLPGQTEFNEKQIAIPVHEGLTDEQIERIVKAIRSGW